MKVYILLSISISLIKLTRQQEILKKLLLKYTINQASTVDYQVHAIVLYEEEVVVDKVGDKLLIV